MSAEPAGAQPTIVEPASAESASAEHTGTGKASGEPVSAGAAGAGAGTVPAGPGPSADIALKVGRAAGAGIGYGCLAAFLYLVGVQVYRWFRDGEWTHFGIGEALRAGLVRCCVNGEDTGRLAALVHWIDAPVDWVGLHRVLELAPASLGLFALSIAGNSVFIYCGDRIDQRRRRVPAEPGESLQGA
jgi:hypothetical protein